jgi:collagen type III alpha
VLGGIILLGVVFGLVFLVAGGGDDAAMKAGDCVKQEGSAAVKTDCGGSGTFQVTSVVEDKNQCTDPAQPSVLTTDGDGKSQVLCLKPNS